MDERFIDRLERAETAPVPGTLAYAQARAEADGSLDDDEDGYDGPLPFPVHESSRAAVSAWRREHPCATTSRGYHMSDCATNNEPAFPAGLCDCGNR